MEVLIKTLISTGLVFITMGYVIFARLISNEIGNPTLKRLLLKSTVFFIMMFLLSILATFADYAMGYRIGWFNAAINYAFRGYILYLLFRLYVKLKEPEIEIEITGGEVTINPEYIHKGRLSVSLDAVFSELKINIQRTKELEHQLSKMR